MKRAIVLITVLLCVPLPAGAQQQQQTEQPWLTWEPPAVEMPDPNAFELYQQAFALVHRLNVPHEHHAPAAAAQAGGGPPVEQAPRETFAMPEPDDEQAMREFLDENRLVFRLLQEAMMGECRLPPVVSPDQLLPYLADFRRAARMFAARARIYREDGHVAESALDAIACVRLSADAMTQHSLLAGLVGIACEAWGLRELDETLPLMQPADCGAAMEALRTAMAERGSLADALQGEQVCSNSALKMIFAGPDSELRASLAQDKGFKKALEAARPAETWRALNEFYRVWAEQAPKPYWARDEVPSPADPLAAMILPLYGRASAKFAWAEAKLRLSLVALAAQAYLVQEGKPLAELDGLVPEYLDEVPADPFADAPLRSKVSPSRTHPSRVHPARGGQARGITIYSVGPDGLDDGGEDAGERLAPEMTGDIVVVL